MATAAKQAMPASAAGATVDALSFVPPDPTTLPKGATLGKFCGFQGVVVVENGYRVVGSTGAAYERIVVARKPPRESIPLKALPLITWQAPAASSEPAVQAEARFWVYSSDIKALEKMVAEVSGLPAAAPAAKSRPPAKESAPAGKALLVIEEPPQRAARIAAARKAWSAAFNEAILDIARKHSDLFNRGKPQPVPPDVKLPLQQAFFAARADATADIRAIEARIAKALADVPTGGDARALLAAQVRALLLVPSGRALLWWAAEGTTPEVPFDRDKPRYRTVKDKGVIKQDRRQLAPGRIARQTRKHRITISTGTVREATPGEHAYAIADRVQGLLAIDPESAPARAEANLTQTWQRVTAGRHGIRLLNGGPPLPGFERLLTALGTWYELAQLWEKTEVDDYWPQLSKATANGDGAPAFVHVDRAWLAIGAVEARYDAPEDVSGPACDTAVRVLLPIFVILAHELLHAHDQRWGTVSRKKAKDGTPGLVGDLAEPIEAFDPKEHAFLTTTRMTGDRQDDLLKHRWTNANELRVMIGPNRTGIPLESDLMDEYGLPVRWAHARDAETSGGKPKP